MHDSLPPIPKGCGVLFQLAWAWCRDRGLTGGATLLFDHSPVAWHPELPPAAEVRPDTFAVVGDRLHVAESGRWREIAPP